MSLRKMQRDPRCKGKSVDYEFLRLQDAVGHITDAITKFKDKRETKKRFREHIRVHLAHALVGLLKLANAAGVDIQKQFEMWDRLRAKGKEIRLGVVKGYSKIARQYDVITKLPAAVEEASVLKLIGPVRGKVVLDAGCGTGRYAIALAKRGALATGVDISGGMLTVARCKARRQKLNVKFRRADMVKLPFPTNSFDVVTSNLAIEHVKDYRKAAAELVRVCKPGGTIVLSTMHPDIGPREEAFFEIAGAAIFIKRYTRSVSEYASALINAGASILGVKDLKIPKRLQPLEPEIYQMVKDKNFILVLKAVKYRARAQP